MERGRMRLLLLEAIKSAKAGNLTWARECLGRVLRADPRNEEAWLWMSAVLETTPEKRYCLERVLSINPDHAQAQAGLRYLDQQAGIEAGAPEPERTICPMCGEPNEPTAFRCANCAQDLFVRCPACGERVDIDHTSCAACELEIGDSSEGAGYFFHLGELYLQSGQPKRALETWDKTLLLDPDYPRVAEVAAEAFLASGQRDLAIQSLQRAIDEAEEERRRELYLRLATYYRETRNTEEASRIYQEMLKEDQERREPRADIYTELGHFYQQEKDIEAARYHYEMAVALEEELYDVHYALAEILLEEGYEHRALNEFRWLQEVGGEEIAAKARAHIESMRPPIPEEFRNRWQETLRGTARFFLGGFLLLLLRTGLDWDSVRALNGVGMFVLLISGYLLTAATATPRNLPSLAKLGALAEGPLMMRLRARRQKAAGRPNFLQRFFQRFLMWQRRSARSLAANLRVTQMRLVKQLQRAMDWTARTWGRLKVSRPARFLGTLPQSRVGRFLSALGKKPFFQAVGRFFRRILPRRRGLSLFQQLGQAIRGGGKRLIDQAGRVEFSEGQLARWGAALLGLVLLVLGVGLVLA